MTPVANRAAGHEMANLNATSITARTPAHAPAQSLRMASSSTQKSRRRRHEPVSGADDFERQYSASNSPTPPPEVSPFPAECEIVGPGSSVLSNLETPRGRGHETLGQAGEAPASRSRAGC